MNVLARLGAIEPAAADKFTALLSPRKFEKDEWLLRGGEKARLCYFIVRGLVLELYVDAAGAEHTRAFLPEGFFTGSLVDLLSGASAITWIQALEPTETLALPYSDFNALCDRYPSLDRVGRRFVENAVRTKGSPRTPVPCVVGARAVPGLDRGITHD